MKNEKGFSLVELLVVVIIIAIIAAIAIPNLLASRRAANEASAVASIRSIHSAQITYFSTTGQNSRYAVALGPVATAGSLAALALVDPQLGSGSKSGFDYVSGGPALSNLFCAHAQATTFGTTGSRDVGVDQTGVVWQNYTDAQLGCTPATGVLVPGAAATVIQ